MNQDSLLVYKTFWTPDRVVNLRKLLGLTQSELAALLRVSVTSISRWEIGRSRVGAMGAMLLGTLAMRRGITFKNFLQ